MKTLGILRHAKADWDEPVSRDFDRGLNDRGRRGAMLMGAEIARCGVPWDRVLASPAARVRQTLDLAMPALDTVWDERLYLAACETLFEVIRERAGESGALLISGHNPGLQELLLALVPPSGENALFDEAARKFPTAAFAVFELDIDTWDQLAEGCGRLVRFTRPRDLDPALGPEH